MHVYNTQTKVKKRSKHGKKLRYIDIETIKNDIETNYKNRVVMSTQDQYNGTAGHFRIFMKLYHKKIFVAYDMENTLCEFITWKHRCVGIGWSAMRNHLYAIKNLYENHGIMIAVDKKSMPKAHGLIRAEKLRNPGTKGARPVTIEMLRIWINHMEHDNEYNSYDKNIWTAAWLGAFFGMKRISEYTYNPDVLVNLTIGDLQFEYHPENEK